MPKQYTINYGDKNIFKTDNIEKPIYLKFLFNLVEGQIDILNPSCSVTFIDSNQHYWLKLGQINFNYNHDLKNQLKQFSIQFISLLRDFEDKSFYIKHGFESGLDKNVIHYHLNDILRKEQALDLKELIEDLTEVLRKTIVKNIIQFYNEDVLKTKNLHFSMKKK